MRAATVVQVLQDLFYCKFYFTCDRSLSQPDRSALRHAGIDMRERTASTESALALAAGVRSPVGSGRIPADKRIFYILK